MVSPRRAAYVSFQSVYSFWASVLSLSAHCPLPFYKPFAFSSLFLIPFTSLFLLLLLLLLLISLSLSLSLSMKERGKHSEVKLRHKFLQGIHEVKIMNNATICNASSGGFLAGFSFGAKSPFGMVVGSC
ncbi:hypothetical protein MANES_15G002975v8 [Manihot esculenta]|uniref:Uncharacterized protein n=1 Tax=Manihot esculenta TaxID=3983 RepID=A0ACB7GCR9_MANES|nr:hypothetical protein MANES_15G002975v8 [Manihot esculenta]